MHYFNPECSSRAMTERWRILLSSIGIMVAVSLSAATIAIFMLYDTARTAHRDRLEEVVQSRARFIEAVGRFDAKFSHGDVSGGPSAATLTQVVDAHENFEGFGETGEFTLARLEDDRIEWLLRHRHTDIEIPISTPLSSELAEPMRRALNGESGTVVGLDYRGAKVLAAYDFVPELGWGVVAKIDVKEINAPFMHAILTASAIAILVIALGVWSILRVTSPLIRRVEARTEDLREAHDRLRASAFEAGLSVEQERRKLAVDLHDGLGQLLTLASMKLGGLRNFPKTNQFKPEILEIEQIVAEAHECCGSVTFQLYPPILHDVGFTQAAEWLADDIERRFGLRVILEEDGQRWPLDEAVRTALFRSLSELLLNVAKHANTPTAHVRLWGEGQRMYTSIEDRGIGFDPESDAPGFGIFSIRERMSHLGGSILIRSTLGKGTKVILDTPMEAGGARVDFEAA
jgi:signal transduction histidine kinase